MGTCKYCGKDAGWFSKVHQECEDKHQQGLKDFSSVLSNFFAQRVSSSEIVKEKRRLTADAFLSEEDVCSLSDMSRGIVKSTCVDERTQKYIYNEQNAEKFKRLKWPDQETTT